MGGLCVRSAREQACVFTEMPNYDNRRVLHRPRVPRLKKLRITTAVQFAKNSTTNKTNHVFVSVNGSLFRTKLKKPLRTNLRGNFDEIVRVVRGALFLSVHLNRGVAYEQFHSTF